MPTLQGQVKSLPFSIKSYQTKDKQLIVEGYASKPIVDRVDDVVLPEAFKSSVKTFKQNSSLMPPLLLEHDVAVGTIIDLEIRPDGLYVKGSIASGYPEANKARAMVEQGVLKFFSIGFIPKGVEYGEHEGKNVRFISQ